MYRIFGLFVLLAVQACAQTLSAGKVSGNTYSNTDLGISYNFPAGWSAVPESDRGVLDVRFTPNKPDGSEIEMFVLDTSLFPGLTPFRISRKNDAGVTYILQPGIREVKLGTEKFVQTDWIREAGKKQLSHSRLAKESNGWRLILLMTAPKRRDADRWISGLSALRFQPTRATEGPPGPIFQLMKKELIAGKSPKPTEPSPPQKATNSVVHNPVLSPVLLQAVIGADGKIKELEPVGGDPKFFKGAMEAVRQWEYRPYLVDGKPIEVYTIMTVSFFVSGPS